MSNSKNEDNLFSFLRILNIFKINWYWFLISLFFFSFISLIVNRYVKEIYSNNITIHLKNNVNPLNSLVENNKFSSINFTDEISFISSYPTILKTVEALGFNVSYFIEGDIKTVETYNWRPITFVPYNLEKHYGLRVLVDVIDTSSFKITVNDGKSFVHSFGDKILYKDGYFKILFNQSFLTEDFIGFFPIISIKWINPHNVAKRYKNKINVDRLYRDASILNVTIEGEDAEKETAFLNKLAEIYISENLSFKNKASSNTLKFIDDQLNEIRDSLNYIESQLQDFKQNNNISKVDKDSERFYSNINLLHSQKSNVIIEQKYLDYLENYLTENSKFDDLIIPSIYGIENNIISSLTDKLINLKLESNTIDPNGNLANPFKNNIENSISKIKINIKDAITSQKATNKILLIDVENRINLIDDMLSSLPLVERQLINIERHYKLSESIYLFLLEKRTETGILASSNVSDASILESSLLQNSQLLSPNRKQNFLIGIILGILIPIIFFTLKLTFNTDITSFQDIKDNTNIPFAGSVGRNFSGSELVVMDKPKSTISEGFRNIRSNVEFLVDQNLDRAKVILLTSSISGEGKTFCAENLASIYSISGKKTILIGADLRKPRMFRIFKDDNTSGLSNYLSGNLTKQELIKKTDYPFLHYINSGPNPPNPAELLDKDNMYELLDYLKKQYDYIIIDTPPICLVSDALPLIDKVDLTLYVVRQNYTKVGLLSYVNEMYKSEKIKNVSIIMNDTDYSLGYGYNYGQGYYYYGQYGSSGYYDQSSYTEND